MAEKIGRASHNCLRDELPQFMDHSTRFSDGDYVRCSCGRVWYVADARFCHYSEIKGRRLRRLIQQGAIPDVEGD